MFLVELFERRASLRDRREVLVLDSAFLREVRKRAAERDDLVVDPDVAVEARDEQLGQCGALRRVLETFPKGVVEQLDAGLVLAP